MNVETVLERLDKVKARGKGAWSACCPAHNDRSPSLSIREVDDRLLLHCFSGCQIDEVVAAMGLELSDLMGERDTDHSPKRRSYFNAKQVLDCIAQDATTVAILGSNLQSRPLSETEHQTLFDAVGRINASLRYVR